MSKMQMTAVTVAATKHIAGLVFARGAANAKAPPAIEALVGSDGFLLRQESDGKDLFKIPTSELKPVLVDYDRAAFGSAGLAAASFAALSVKDRVHYQVQNGAVVSIATTLPSSIFSLTKTGVTVTLAAPALAPTAAWLVLFSPPDTVMFGSVTIAAGQNTGAIPGVTPGTRTYSAIALLQGFQPFFDGNVTAPRVFPP
jgi:hypothetical protein